MSGAARVGEPGTQRYPADEQRTQPVLSWSLGIRRLVGGCRVPPTAACCL